MTIPPISFELYDIEQLNENVLRMDSMSLRPFCSNPNNKKVMGKTVLFFSYFFVLNI